MFQICLSDIPALRNLFDIFKQVWTVQFINVLNQIKIPSKADA